MASNRDINDKINMTLHEMVGWAASVAGLSQDDERREHLEELRNDLADAIESLLCPNEFNQGVS